MLARDASRNIAGIESWGSAAACGGRRGGSLRRIDFVHRGHFCRYLQHLSAWKLSDWIRSAIAEIMFKGLLVFMLLF